MPISSNAAFIAAFAISFIILKRKNSLISVTDKE
nr:MAG TPA: hypothetical protein [Caudoviricetes sp.]